MFRFVLLGQTEKFRGNPVRTCLFTSRDALSWASSTLLISLGNPWNFALQKESGSLRRWCVVYLLNSSIVEGLEFLRPTAKDMPYPERLRPALFTCQHVMVPCFVRLPLHILHALIFQVLPMFHHCGRASTCLRPAFGLLHCTCLSTPLVLSEGALPVASLRARPRGLDPPISRLPAHRSGPTEAAQQEFRGAWGESASLECRYGYRHLCCFYRWYISRSQLKEGNVGLFIGGGGGCGLTQEFSFLAS